VLLPTDRWLWSKCNYGREQGVLIITRAAMLNMTVFVSWRSIKMTASGLQRSRLRGPSSGSHSQSHSHSRLISAISNFDQNASERRHVGKAGARLLALNEHPHIGCTPLLLDRSDHWPSTARIGIPVRRPSLSYTVGTIRAFGPRSKDTRWYD